MASLQDALGHFNTDKPAWYGWTDSSLGMIYSNLKLNDDTATMPSEEDVNAKIAEIQIQEDRKYAYPEIAEQLDLLWHAIEDGNFTNAKLKNTDFYLKLKEVKDDNPKS